MDDPKVRAEVERLTGPYDARKSYANGHRNSLGGHIKDHGCNPETCPVGSLFLRGARFAARMSR